ncbi:antitoxin family protein [Argonema antarcticum]|uniref:antitoxin family protein n=1 Tax=Argonema antarcticum TaxID=2942763 RepID=UPI0020117CAC|nr:antitoxin family protein [Argonema antarcticum]MCL1470716.1 antitoxin family protein [Argonema antarcticum A004/B2]
MVVTNKGALGSISIDENQMDCDMLQTQTIKAIYEDGVLHPLQALEGLAEHARVKITIHCEESLPHPLLQFSGILSDKEAEELQLTIADEFGKIDTYGW